MMNLLDNPVSRLLGPTDREPTAAEIAEDEKRERIEFHRRHVRNGPITSKSPTSGQVRRARVRHNRKQAKVRRRQQIRTWKADVREHAVLRGQLQAVGVLQYQHSASPYLPESMDHVVVAVGQELTRKFHVRDDEGNLSIELSYLAALNRFLTLSGQQPVESFEEFYARQRAEAEREAALEARWQQEQDELDELVAIEGIRS